MNIKYLKRIIIILIVLMLIVGTIIISLNIYNSNRFAKENGEGISSEQDFAIRSKEFNTLQIVSNRNTYYSIENIANKYANTIKNYYTDITYNRLDGEIKVTDEEKERYFEEIKLLYKLDNITDDELINKISIFKECQYFLIDKIYMYKINDEKVIYPINSYIVNQDKSLIHILLFIQIDTKNNTFNVLQEDYNKNIEEVVQKINFDTIEKKNNNTMTYLSITDADWIVKCFNDYKQKITMSPEYFYTKLNEQYREKRFGNEETFEKYVKANYATIYSAKLDKYKVTKNSDYTEYIYIDQYGRYYIMQETNPLDYKMFLDSYTIDRPEFIEKYDNGNDKTKVELNIGRFIEALNSKDYEYIYNHLNEEFKNNNYKTLELLENYIKNNFYDKCSIELKEYNENNGIYVYDLILKNAKNETEFKSLRIVLQLKDNRDFVMSFSI